MLSVQRSGTDQVSPVDRTNKAGPSPRRPWVVSVVAWCQEGTCSRTPWIPPGCVAAYPSPSGPGYPTDPVVSGLQWSLPTTRRLFHGIPASPDSPLVEISGLYRRTFSLPKPRAKRLSGSCQHSSRTDPVRPFLELRRPGNNHRLSSWTRTKARREASRYKREVQQTTGSRRQHSHRGRRYCTFF